MNKKFKLLMILKIVGGILLFVPLFIFGTMYLWNWIVPELFHGPVINFWQTLGIIALSKIIFGGFGKGHHGKHSRWKERMKEKMGNMTPEEKEQFKQRLKDKCRSTYWGKEEAKSDDLTKSDLT